VTGETYFPPGPHRPRTAAASRLLAEYTDEWARLIVQQAELIAARAGSSEVAEEHIRQAQQRLEHRGREGQVPRLIRFIGAAAFGAGHQGFVGELLVQPMSPIRIVVWVAPAFIGFAAGIRASDTE
jgi:hypothetical protein